MATIGGLKSRLAEDNDGDGVSDDCNSNGAADQVGFTDPRAVESITANVLWDLVDSNNDADLFGTGIPEIRLGELGGLPGTLSLRLVIVRGAGGR